MLIGIFRMCFSNLQADEETNPFFKFWNSIKPF